MKPLAWTKTQSGMPLSSDSASSRTPRHSSNRLNLHTHTHKHDTINNNMTLFKSSHCKLCALKTHLFWKVLGPAGTHWTLHCPFWSGYRTNLMATSTFISFSRANRCSFHGHPPWASDTISPLGSTCTQEQILSPVPSWLISIMMVLAFVRFGMQAHIWPDICSEQPAVLHLSLEARRSCSNSNGPWIQLPQEPWLYGNPPVGWT